MTLLSCMTLNGKNIQIIFLHYKYKLFTVLNCPRNFGNAVKDGSKRTSHWGRTTLQIQILAILYLNLPWFCRSYQQFNRYHLCRWHHRAYRRWGTGRKHLLRQCVSALSVRKQSARAGPSPLYLYQRGNGQPQKLWLRGNNTKRRWNIGIRLPEWWWWYSIFRTKDWFDLTDERIRTGRAVSKKRITMPTSA